MREMEDEKRTQRSPGQGLSGADFAGVGIQFAVAIIVFLFAGQWLDKRVGTKGLFTVAFVFIGAGAAFYSMYRKISAAQKRDDAERAARRQSGDGDRTPGR
ncbi:MAG TPA: AtpZ/AtpI family protein [Gemmatimonadaceae bacterium]|nr:AtpZ/AtpI family protein [Gemmatimonadaceae bacterium]